MTRPRRPRPLRRTHTELLLAAAREDDREAFRELVEQLTPRLTATAYRMVPPASCDDLVQATWLRAWQYRRSYRGAATPSTWLYMIMSRVAWDRRWWTTTTGFVDVEIACVRSDADFEAVLVAKDVDYALACLDTREAMVVRRRDLQRQEWSTICQAMEFDDRYQAKKTYDLAKAKLIAYFQRPGGGDHTAL